MICRLGLNKSRKAQTYLRLCSDGPSEFSRGQKRKVRARATKNKEGQSRPLTSKGGRPTGKKTPAPTPKPHQEQHQGKHCLAFKAQHTLCTTHHSQLQGLPAGTVLHDQLQPIRRRLNLSSLTSTAFCLCLLPLLLLSLSANQPTNHHDHHDSPLLPPPLPAAPRSSLRRYPIRSID